jgi:1-acyl-sn-glycerol-3-phosphate acyltransferase
MHTILRFIFYFVFIKTAVLFLLGTNIRHREKLPKKGPAIIVANHNSHLDTMVLVSILPINQLKKIRPAAAADYFLKNKILSWFAQNIIGIIPLKRGIDKTSADPFEPCYRHLEQDGILILFPEGSRGEPEKLSTFKNGIARLAKNQAHVSIIPIFMYGLGKALPKGEVILVPFFCDIFVGDALRWENDRNKFISELKTSFGDLAKQGHFAAWE